MPRPIHVWLCAVFIVLVAAPLAAAQAADPGGALFPDPFVIEHHLVQTEDDGSRFVSDPVTDYYTGSWIVSLRPDGSRRIVDLARREITEVRPETGTYWTVSFDRLGELAEGIRRVSAPGGAVIEDEAEAGDAFRSTAAISATDGSLSGPPELLVQELPAAVARATSISAASRVSRPDAEAGGDTGTSDPPPAARPGVSRLRVVEAARAEQPEAGLEVWLDPTVRLRPAAIDALASLEAAVTTPRRSVRSAEDDGASRATGALGADGPAPRTATPGEQLAAARRHAAGAVPVHTLRALTSPDGGEAGGTLEDVATRLEPVEALPPDLLTIPEGLRRVPHPAEGMLRALEEEAALNRRLAGGGR